MAFLFTLMRLNVLRFFEGRTVSGTVFLSLATGLIAQEIVDDLESALEQFRLIANDLDSDTSEKVT